MTTGIGEFQSHAIELEFFFILLQFDTVRKALFFFKPERKKNQTSENLLYFEIKSWMHDIL